MKFSNQLLLAGLVIATSGPALAQEFKRGDIVVDQPWARATPKGAPVGGAYMVIHNTGTTADRLTGGSTAAAGSVDVHQMSMDHGIMRMRPVQGGLVVPPGGEVVLDPNGYHLMLNDLKKPLVKGTDVAATLTFQKAGQIPVELKVGGFGDMGPAGASPPQGAMPAMKMNGMMPGH